MGKKTQKYKNGGQIKLPEYPFVQYFFVLLFYPCGLSILSSLLIVNLRWSIRKKYEAETDLKKMVVTESSFISTTKLSSYLLVRENGRKFATTLAKKGDLSETSRTQKKPSFPLRVSNKVLAQSAIALFGLGFIDAG